MTTTHLLEAMSSYVVQSEKIVLLGPAMRVCHRAILTDLAMRLTSERVNQTGCSRTTADSQAEVIMSVNNDLTD